MRAGIRIAVSDEKEDAMDFVLWKPKKEGEPAWVSPWGEGRPGWHIECSEMSKKYIGDTIDIHAGGEDLVFLIMRMKSHRAKRATMKSLQITGCIMHS